MTTTKKGQQKSLFATAEAYRTDVYAHQLAPIGWYLTYVALILLREEFFSVCSGRLCSGYLMKNEKAQKVHIEENILKEYLTL